MPAGAAGFLDGQVSWMGSLLHPNGIPAQAGLYAAGKPTARLPSGEYGAGQGQQGAGQGQHH